MSTVYDLSFAQLAERLGTWGEPSFRAKQVWSQLWKRAATYDAMSDVAPALRERLAAELPLGVEVLDERTADRGGTRKALLKLGGTHVIEAVLMGYRDRVTVCVSSQAGCAMACTFCATGQAGLDRHLDTGEIVEQVMRAQHGSPQRVSNVVFMGMGEPLANYDETLRAIRLLTHLRTFGHCFNPVSFYYCYAADGVTLDTIVAEITNTPWKERHSYVLPVGRAERHGRALRWEFAKAFHVSPFEAMERGYAWRFTAPGDELRVHMDVLDGVRRDFDATLVLERQPLTGPNLARVLRRYPAMTLRVVAAIHWQAFLIFLRQNPVYDHPSTRHAGAPTRTRSQGNLPR